MKHFILAVIVLSAVVSRDFVSASENLRASRPYPPSSHIVPNPFGFEPATNADDDDGGDTFSRPHRYWEDSEEGGKWDDYSPPESDNSDEGPEIS